MVEWKKLGEVCSFHRGNTITAKNAIDGNIPVIAGGQKPSYYHNESNRTGESITIAGSGAYAGFVAYWNQPIYVSDAFTADPSDKLLHKYLFQWLKMNQEKIFATQKGAGVPHVHGKDIANFSIPIPSLSEQERIVGILDTFTASIDNLKEQIAQRRKQYSWLLDKLYFADKRSLLSAKETGKTEVKTFDEIGTFTRGRRFVRTDIVENGVPCIHYGDMYTYYGVSADKTPTYLTKELAAKLRFAKKGDVVIVAAGENDIDIGVGVAWFGEEDVVVHDACFIFKHNMNPKYLSYFMRSMNYHLQIRMGVVDGKICSISAKELGRTLIPVPSISEQERIVGILDTFEASITNLEAQLAMRQKQYEYYRNKLLTFE